MNSYEEVSSSSRLWDKQDLAEFLGMSIYWIDKHVMHNAPDPIPHLKIGKRVRFDPNDEEVFRIKGSNVFLDKGYLFNPYGETKAAKRKIPLNEQAIDVLSRRASEAKGPYLFPATRLVLLTDQEKTVRSSKARTPLKVTTKHRRRLDYKLKKVLDYPRYVTKLNNAHYRALRDSELPHFRIYDLRHTWATRAAESGI